MPSPVTADSQTARPAPPELLVTAGAAIQLINLIVHAYLRYTVRIELLQHRVDLPDSLPAIGVARVDQVQNQVCLARLLQRGPESRDELVRQSP